MKDVHTATSTIQVQATIWCDEVARLSIEYANALCWPTLNDSTPRAVYCVVLAAQYCKYACRVCNRHAGHVGNSGEYL